MIVDHVAIRAKDIEKVALWYQERLGAVVSHPDRDWETTSTSS